MTKYLNPATVAMLLVAAALIFVLFFTDWTAGNAAASTRTLPPQYDIEKVPYMGRTLYCLVRDKEDGYGQGSGVSCDFVRFYRRR